MKYTTLGPHGPKVSVIAIGTWELTSAWRTDIQAATAALRRAADLGINCFDTARGYGFGVAESGLGDALHDLLLVNRDEFVIVTKGGLEQGDGVGYRNSDPTFLRRDIEASLKALHLDYVDVFLIHWPDPNVPLEEAAGGLQAIVDAGLARSIGVSNFDVEQMMKMGGRSGIHVAQVPYNLLCRHVDHQIIPYCVSEGIGIMGYSPLAQGLLTGTMSAARPPHGDWRAADPEFQGARFAARLEAVERLRETAVVRSSTVSQLALAWILANPAGVIPVLGVQSSEDVEDSLDAIDVQLSPDEARAIEALMAAAPEIDPASRRSPPVKPKNDPSVRRSC